MEPKTTEEIAEAVAAYDWYLDKNLEATPRGATIAQIVRDVLAYFAGIPTNVPLPIDAVVKLYQVAKSASRN